MGTYPWRAAADYPRRRGDELRYSPRPARSSGLPPQARGRVSVELENNPINRTTPAGAGTSCAGRRPRTPASDHPRRRGDEGTSGFSTLAMGGPPPQTRGRGSAPRSGGPGSGTTPADAGTRRCRRRRPPRPSDHPRRRGDEPAPDADGYVDAGPPPQARGRGDIPGDSDLTVRTTPAGAGTRRCGHGSCRAWRDHPRRRGDESTTCHKCQTDRGTTPAGAGTSSERPKL